MSKEIEFVRNIYAKEEEKRDTKAQFELRLNPYGLKLTCAATADLELSVRRSETLLKF